MFYALILEANMINADSNQGTHQRENNPDCKTPCGYEATGLAKWFEIHYLSFTAPLPPSSTAPESGASPSIKWSPKVQTLLIGLGTARCRNWGFSAWCHWQMCWAGVTWLECGPKLMKTKARSGEGRAGPAVGGKQTHLFSQRCPFKVWTQPVVRFEWCIGQGCWSSILPTGELFITVSQSSFPLV